VTRDEWITVFSQRLGVEPPDDSTIKELLELAGSAAHGSERTAAPIACYLVGQCGIPAVEALAAALGIGVVVDLIQSAGRPDITAKLHLLELPVYLVAVWFLTKRLGVEGTAIAWTGRTMLDALLLFLFAYRMRSGRMKFLVNLGAATAVVMLLAYLGTLPTRLSLKLDFLALSLLVFGVASWFLVVDVSERNFLIGAAKKASARSSRF